MLLKESLAIFEQLDQQFPNFPTYRSSLMTVYLHLAGISREREDYATAADLLERAISIQRLLVEEFPQRPDYRSDLAKLLNDLAGLQRHARRKLIESNCRKFDGVG